MSPLFRRRAGGARPSMSEVTATEAAELSDHGALLIDVREPYEWAAGHAPAARHIPIGQLAQVVPELPGDARLIVVCRSGNRSAQATQMLTAAGLDAANLTGGMTAWMRTGLPVVTDSGSPGTVA